MVEARFVTECHLHRFSRKTYLCTWLPLLKESKVSIVTFSWKGLLHSSKKLLCVTLFHLFVGSYHEYDHWDPSCTEPSPLDTHWSPDFGRGWWRSPVLVRSGRGQYTCSVATEALSCVNCKGFYSQATVLALFVQAFQCDRSLSARSHDVCLRHKLTFLFSLQQLATPRPDEWTRFQRAIQDIQANASSNLGETVGSPRMSPSKLPFS